ncbi:uncharacterized protein LOC125668673 [Ostrea edulis]|uniref:uncharacterized protein LOC125668673 n=1 Tax=Ostrea edulis TaxID=37623 RepID=UPI0020961581|nr:uncharacterized protein LOC125668673 [Ostrea edulis]
MADDKTSLVAGNKKDLEGGIYYEQTPATRCLQVGFVALVVIMVIISIILSMVRGTDLGTYGGGHFMLGISLIGFVVLEICMIVFIRRGDLPKEKTWFLYFVGGCVILEAIFTDILLFQ